MKQVFNPYMPSFEYVPDGEPHVFGDRIYVYGSHDRFNGAAFCLNDYICYSAPVTDLSDWTYEGIIYRKEQDPRNQNVPENAERFSQVWELETDDPDNLNPPGIHAMWAPDVVKGPDGRFYLYYCLDFLKEVAVAVCDTPAGKYEFYGFVKHADGTVLGNAAGDSEQFDPGIFIDDDGEIYLYCGHTPMNRNVPPSPILRSQVMSLCEDMLTLKTEPVQLLSDIYTSEGTGYEGHEFFEASSIRKINGLYYFVYSSVQSHELCYAVSDRPAGGYRFGGTIVDIADVFLDGRTEANALNSFGNTHGGIECCDGQWYVFYHRQTNRTQFSRQGCAEKIYFDEKGRIPQVEVTSCGLNRGPLKGNGKYPARIACQLTRGGTNVVSLPDWMKEEYPYFTQDMKDAEPTPELLSKDAEFPIQYITNLQDGCTVGYKYFAFDKQVEKTEDAESCGNNCLSMTVRGKFDGKVLVYTTEKEALEGEHVKYEDRKVLCAEVPLKIEGTAWTKATAKLCVAAGVRPLYFEVQGEGAFDFVEFEL